MLLHKAAESSEWYFTAKRPNPRAQKGNLGQLHSQPLICPFKDSQCIHLKCCIINYITVLFISTLRG